MEGGRKRVLTLKNHYSISSPDLKGQNIKGANDYQRPPMQIPWSLQAYFKSLIKKIIIFHRANRGQEAQYWKSIDKQERFFRATGKLD